MFTFYDLAEIGAGFAAFFTMLFVLVRRPGQISANLFVVATLLTTIMWALFIAFVPRTNDLLLWQHGLLVSSLGLASGFWLTFLLLFAREPGTNLFRRRSLTAYGLLGLFAVAGLIGFFKPYFTLEVVDDVRLFSITPTGKYFLTIIIIANTMGLLQIENTFRASQGALRRQLLPSLITTALMLAVNIITGMLGLLISRVEFISVQLGALLMIFSMIFLARFVGLEQRRGQGVVISREAVYSSVALVIVGAYFVMIGIAVKLLVSLGGSPQVFLSVLAAFVVIVIFVALLLSGSIRRRWQGMVDRTVSLGRADLLAAITAFAEEVTTATDKREMFAVMAGVLRRKCGLTEVDVYLRGGRPSEFFLSYPTVAVESEALPEFGPWLFRSGRTIAAAEYRPAEAKEHSGESEFLQRHAGRLFIPLVARKELIGFIAAGGSDNLSTEMRFLIDSISHQLALSLLSARQSEALLETRELASFTKLSSFVIHDVKNLISMVSMIVQNAERKFDDPRFQQMTIETLRGAQERMQRLIGRLTSPSKQIDFALSPCDLRGITLSLVDEMKLSSQQKVQVEIELSDIPPVKGNAEKLRSVITNLVINAIEAMPNGGRLTVSATVNGADVSLAVTDTGVGMTPDFIRDRLFRPFQTSKPSGLGIGLYQSRELVEQMGGSLTVNSIAGQGSSFKLKLKRA